METYFQYGQNYSVKMTFIDRWTKDTDIETEIDKKKMLR